MEMYSLKSCPIQNHTKGNIFKCQCFKTHRNATYKFLDHSKPYEMHHFQISMLQNNGYTTIEILDYSKPLEYSIFKGTSLFPLGVVQTGKTKHVPIRILCIRGGLAPAAGGPADQRLHREQCKTDRQTARHIHRPLDPQRIWCRGGGPAPCAGGGPAAQNLHQERHRRTGRPTDCASVTHLGLTLA